MAPAGVRAGVGVLGLACVVWIGVVWIASGEGGSADESLPAWVTAEMERLEGRWVADNSAYRNAGEPYDAYGMEWTFAPGRQSLRGRLFAIEGGKEIGIFWEFRQFWHPGKEALWLVQFGSDGAFGEGAIESTGPDSTQVEQTFFARNGSSWRAGHREVHDDGQRSSQSFAIEADGTWRPQRAYVWLKETEHRPRVEGAAIDR